MVCALFFDRGVRAVLRCIFAFVSFPSDTFEKNPIFVLVNFLHRDIETLMVQQLLLWAYLSQMPNKDRKYKGMTTLTYVSLQLSKYLQVLVS